MRDSFTAAILSFLTTSLVAVSLFAAEANGPKPGTTTQGQFLSTIDSTHTLLSNTIIGTSLRLDNLLGYDEIEDETPGSHVRIEAISNNDRNNGQQLRTRIRTRIALPRTQKRLQLFVNNLKDDDKDDSLVASEDYATGSDQENPDRLGLSDFAAGIRKMLITSESFHLHTDAGVKLKVPADPFVRIKARQSFQPDSIAVHLTQHAYAFKYAGYGYDLGLSFDRPLGYKYSLRQSNLAIYSHSDHFHRLQNGLSLVRLLGKKRSVSYFVSSAGITKPKTHVTSYSLGLTYRSPTPLHWVVFEVSPTISYPRTHNFTANPGITLQIESRFGAM